LEDTYATAPSDTLAEQITATSLAHGVLSRFTAFVAIDRSDPTGSTSPRPVVQPVESPRGWAPAAAAAAAGAAGGGVRNLSRRVGAMPMPRLRNAAFRKPDPSSGIEGLLRRIEGWLVDEAQAPSLEDREKAAAELDEVALDASDDAVRKAVSELAAAVRSWIDVGDKAKAVRRALERNRRGFWR
jgi:hypothetical protein